ncbi:ABC transporter substrate-binding protein [Bacillus velezensis]
MKTMHRTARKPGDPLKIEIDTSPIRLNPLDTQDYTSKMICSIMYESLQDGYNCRIIRKDRRTCQVDIHPDYLGDAEGVVQTIIYHLTKENQSPHLGSFLNIKQAVPYVKGLVSSDQLGVNVTGEKRFEVTLDEPSDEIEAVLQSSFLIPGTAGGDVPENGPYRFKRTFEKGLEFERNPQYKMTPADHRTVQIIQFILNDDLEKSIGLYEANQTDVTCHTQFHHSNMRYRQYADFKENHLPMLFTFKVKDGMLRTFIQHYFDKQKLAGDLGHIITPTDSLIGIWESGRTPKKDPTLLTKEEPIRIVYADYYPNGEIIERLAELFRRAGADVSVSRVSHFNDYYHMDKSGFDIELHLFLPAYMHELSYIKYFIRDISDPGKKKTIIDAIGSEKKKELFELFENTTHYCPICFGKSLYLQDPCIEGFSVKTDGLLSVHDVKCR